jgi:hypothetical protein
LSLKPVKQESALMTFSRHQLAINRLLRQFDPKRAALYQHKIQIYSAIFKPPGPKRRSFESIPRNITGNRETQYET